jgi:hypothetical protein
MPPVTIDLARWPIVLVEWPEQLSIADMEEYFARLARLCENKRFAIVLDATRSDPLKYPAAHRKRLSELATQHKPLLARACICQAFVITSPLVRGILTALHWFVRADWPQEFFSSRDNALRWVRRHTTQRPSMAPPPA